MSDIRCYSCGFRTAKRELFVRGNGNGDKHWYDFSCPQCCRANPRLADAETHFGDPPPYFDPPKWTVEESNHGLYVSSNCLSCPMIPEHQLWKAPAKLIAPAFVGTMGDYSKALIRCGEERSKQFHASFDGAIKERESRIAAGEFEPDVHVWFDKVTDGYREACKIGDYDEKKEHDGWTLEAAARKAAIRL